MARRLLAFLLVVAVVVLGACNGPGTDPPDDGNGAVRFTLTLQTAGTGSGNVTSVPAGINLATGATAASFDEGTPITLTADPSAGSTFAGWSGGGCSGTGTCAVTLSANTIVTATFELDDDDPLGQADVEAVVGAIGSSVVAVGTELIDDPAVFAMLSFDPTCMDKETDELKRGIFQYDPVSGDWEVIDPSVAYVACRWPFWDADGDLREAELRIDWGGTTYVGWRWGPDQEVPASGMTVRLTVDGVPAGQVDASLEWYQAPACSDGVLEPTSVGVTGSMGLLATLSLNDIVYTMSDTQLATSGTILAESSMAEVGIEWDVAIVGSVTRTEACFIDDFDLGSGDVSVTAFAEADGARSSLGFNLAFANLVYDDDLEWLLESVDVSGSVDVNEARAVTFTGTLDDLNEPVPGANVIITFADGSSMTLKAFIENVQLLANTASRLRSLVR